MRVRIVFAPILVGGLDALLNVLCTVVRFFVPSERVVGLVASGQTYYFLPSSRSIMSDSACSCVVIFSKQKIS